MFYKNLVEPRTLKEVKVRQRTILLWKRLTVCFPRETPIQYLYSTETVVLRKVLVTGSKSYSTKVEYAHFFYNLKCLYLVINIQTFGRKRFVLMLNKKCDM